MTGYLFALGLRRVLVLRLIAAHQAARSILGRPLVRCVRDVCQILSLALVVGRCVGAALRVLRVVCLGVHDEGCHVVLNILLHEQVVLTILIKKIIAIVAFHYFIDSIVLIKVEGAACIFLHVHGFFVGAQLFAMFLEEQSQLLVDLVLRETLEALAS